MKIDDPVGALSVHLVCGIWGTLAVPIFAMAEKAPKYGDVATSFGGQLISILIIGAFCLVTSAIIFLALKFTLGIRVSREEELEGLDIGEHGMEAYSGFQIFTNE